MNYDDYDFSSPSSDARNPGSESGGAGFGMGPLGPGYDFNRDGNISFPEQIPPPIVFEQLMGSEQPASSAPKARSSSSGCFDSFLGCAYLIVMLVAGAVVFTLFVQLFV